MAAANCTVEGCTRTAKSRGYCTSHYMRWWRYGDPEHTHKRIVNRPVIDIATRFWSKVDLSNPDGCWLWAGSRRHTYGEIYVDGVKHYAHRVAWELIHRNPLSDGEEICHTCDTPLCVRPDHLVAASHAVNLRDMAAKGRWHNQYAAGPGTIDG